MAFNLPPGCRVSDIPGNRPEDIIREAQEDALTSLLPNVELTDEQLNKLITMLEQSFGDGYRTGANDEREAKAYKSELSESEWRTIHNALAVYQCTYREGVTTEGKVSMRKQIQQLMDKVRDNHIAPNE